MYDCVKIKYLGPTGNKGARIKITVNGESKIYDREYSLSPDAQIENILLDKYGYQTLLIHWERDVGYVFCKQ